MPNIFANSMVAHVWAQQSQAKGRSHNGNMSFDGPALYSYAEPIARFVKGGVDQTVILISTGKWSITTSRHQSRAHSAARNHGAVFSVADIGRYGAPDHVQNLSDMVSAYQTAMATIQRATREITEYTFHTPERIAREANEYAAAFGLPAPGIDHEANVAVVTRFRAERDAQLNTPERIAKRTAERARRETLRAERETRQREAAIASATIAIRDWRNGAANHLPYDARHDANGGALLRIRGDNLETSLGATVPLSHAILAFRHMLQCRETGQSWERNGHTIRVGQFQIDLINSDGSFRAGCHAVHWPEVESAARIAGVLA